MSWGCSGDPNPEGSRHAGRREHKPLRIRGQPGRWTEAGSRATARSTISARTVPTPVVAALVIRTPDRPRRTTDQALTPTRPSNRPKTAGDRESQSAGDDEDVDGDRVLGADHQGVDVQRLED